MKIEFFDNAGPVDFWRPDWEDNSSSTLLETDSALLDWTSGIGLGFDEKMFVTFFCILLIFSEVFCDALRIHRTLIPGSIKPVLNWEIFWFRE